MTASLPPIVCTGLPTVSGSVSVSVPVSVPVSVSVSVTESVSVSVPVSVPLSVSVRVFSSFSGGHRCVWDRQQRRVNRYRTGRRTVFSRYCPVLTVRDLVVIGVDVILSYASKHRVICSFHSNIDFG